MNQKTRSPGRLDDGSKTSWDIVNTPSSLDGKDEHKLEYLKAMIQLAQEDKQIVRLYITLALGLTVFAISQLELSVIVTLRTEIRILLFVGILLVSFAAYFFFLYVRALHITRMNMIRCLVALDVRKTRELWAGPAGVWAQHGWKYNVGRACMAFGVAAFVLALAYLFLFFVPPPET